jgi:hypothetical protein
LTIDLDRDGFALLPGVLTEAECESACAGLAAALAGSAIGPAEAVAAARKVLALWPDADRVWRTPALTAALAAALGPRFGLVRGLFFDKPPDRTWALPWHQDLTVAVREHRPNRAGFGKPTVKGGVPHFEAPVGVLEGMLAVRLHLDPATDENGPLRVVPGSHRHGKRLVLDAGPVTVHARRGDALLMRPLLAHSSGRSHPKTRRHRRVLHLEFAAGPELPGGHEWHTFRPGLG